MSCDRGCVGVGRLGIDVSGVLKFSAVVKSPTVARRHALKFGTSAPNRVSKNRSSEVWSNKSELTNPPRPKGERMSIGTRKPSPIGPVIAGLPTTVGSGTAGRVTYSPGVPGGAVVGGTWSKNPPFSSNVKNKIVFAQSPGFAARAPITSDRMFSPNTDGAGG